jgi:hypothetical protein
MSLFCSAIRPHIWKEFLASVKDSSENIEVVFGGPLTPEEVNPFLTKYTFFKYIYTKDIKPVQIYEVCRRACTGELISWTADDASFPNDVLGKEYRYFKEHCGRKDILSVQTRENYGEWRMCDINAHKFFGDDIKAPKMAPMGVVNREYFQELGGIDRRFISGQWDNELVMRMYNDGAKIFHFSEAWIDLDHWNKHDIRYRTGTDRPFAKGYNHDRRILEGAWGKKGQMKYDVIPYQRYDAGFEPFEDTDLLTKSQSFTLKDVWHD